MLEERRRNWLTVVRRAVLSPFSLSALALGLVWVVLFSGGVVGFAGLMAAATAIAAYTLGKLNDESFIRAAIRESGERDRRASARERVFRIEELDVDSRVRMKAIVRLANDIAADVVNSPVDEVAVGLADTVQRTEAIADRGLALGQRRRQLLRYLSRTDSKVIETRIGSIQSHLDAESDPQKRAELEASLTAKKHELDDYRAIQQTADRILVELDGIECAFASLRARIVRIQSSDIRDWTEANTELQTELGGLDIAVGTLEQSIEEALTLRNMQ